MMPKSPVENAAMIQRLHRAIGEKMLANRVDKSAR
jgi:hypothetical protein